MDEVLKIALAEPLPAASRRRRTAEVDDRGDATTH